MKHLSNLEIQGFAHRQLPSGALLESDSHLAECQACQTALEQAGPAYSDSQVAAIFAGPATHLTYAELRAFAENEPVADSVTRHTASCESCSREAAELREFITELVKTPRSTASAASQNAALRFNRTWYAVAAVILLAAVVGLYWRNSLQHATANNLIASVQDGNGQVALGRGGQLLGDSTLTAQQRDMLLSAMTSGKLDVGRPAEFAGQKAETMLGAPSATASFKVLSPVGRVSVEDRPTFQWESLEGATGYRVVIYGEGYQKIAESPVLHGTQWQAPLPLPRGAVFSWTVTASVPHGSVHSPAPPQPEAIFKIVTAEDASELAASVRDHADDPLLLAVLYARVGAVEESLAQIDRLAAQNPNSSLVAQWKASLAETSAAQAPSPIKTNAAQ